MESVHQKEESRDSIKLNDFIYEIIKNNVNYYYEKLNNFPFDFIVNSLKDENLYLILRSLTYFSSPKNFKENAINKNKNKSIINIILIILTYIVEHNEDKSNIISKYKELIIKNIFQIVKKLYNVNVLNCQDLSIISKYLVCLSFMQRKDIEYNINNANNNYKYIINNYNLNTNINSLNNNNYYQDIFENHFKYYEIFNLSILYITSINILDVTVDYCDFLGKIIEVNKSIKYHIVTQVNILEILFLDSNNIKELKNENMNNNNENNLNENIEDDKVNKIYDFLTELYAFHYNKDFYKIFMQKIKDCYSNQLENIKKDLLFDNLSKSIKLLEKLNNYEEKELDRDPYLINRGYIFTNTEKNGIFVENINLDTKMTLLFSFNFSPYLIDNEINILKEYPLLYFVNRTESDEFMGFYIKNYYVYYITIQKEIIRVCQIKPKYSYLVYYETSENEGFTISIKGIDKEKEFKSENKLLIYRKNLTLNIGKFRQNNYEGLIGPIIIFSEVFDEDFKSSFFDLKGHYEKMLYLNNYISVQKDKYDKYMNSFSEDADNTNANFFEALVFFKKKDYTFYLDKYIRPLHSSCQYKKKSYKIDTFGQTILNFYIEPKISNNATYCIENNFTTFEFLKNIGIYYIILDYELICANFDFDKKNLNDSSIISSIDKMIDFFCQLLSYTMDFFFQLNIDLYVKEIRMLIFSIAKTVLKSCEYKKLPLSIVSMINRWIITLNTQNPNYSRTTLKFHNLINNQICKILLDVSLYDLKDFSTMEYFIASFDNCILKGVKGLHTHEYLFLIIKFSKFYDIVNKNDDIRHNKEFKKLKNVYNEMIYNYINRTDDITYYYEIIEMFSFDFNLDYKKYQFIKIFYWICDYFFRNTKEEYKYKVLKYFIDLYENLLNYDPIRKMSNSSLQESLVILLNEKEVQIIMAICLRIIFEYPITEYFYSGPIPKKRKSSQFFIIASSIMQKVPLQFTKKNDDTSKDSNISIVTKPLISFEDSSEDKNRRKNSIALKYNFKSLTISTSNNDTSLYENYETFDKLLLKLSKSDKNNDYIIKGVLLLLIENINNLAISNKEKIKFIIKIKGFLELYVNDFDKKISKLNYYNKEIDRYFKYIALMIESSKNNINAISYEFFMYILINICKNREENKCAFNHFVSSKKICNKVLCLAILNNQAATQTLMGIFPTFSNLIIPYNHCSFLYDFIFKTITISGKFSTGVTLLNQMIMLNFRAEFEKTRNFYFHKINIIKMINELLHKSYLWNSVNSNNVEIEEEGLKTLFDEDLIKTKFNIYSDNPYKFKTTYLESYFDMIIKLSKRTKNPKYIYILASLLITNITYNKNNKVNHNNFSNNNSSNVLYLCDCDNYNKKINENIYKLFKKSDLIEIPCLSLFVFIKALECYKKNLSLNNGLASFFKEICITSFQSVKALFIEHKDYKASVKNRDKYNSYYTYNQMQKNLRRITVYNKIVAAVIEEMKKDKQCSAKFILDNYDEYLVTVYDKKKQDDVDSKSNHSCVFYQTHQIHENMKIGEVFDENSLDFLVSNKDPLNNSFASCSSTKSQKNKCYLFHKRKLILHDKPLIYKEQNIFEFDNNNSNMDDEDMENNSNDKENNSNNNDENNSVNSRKKNYSIETFFPEVDFKSKMLKYGYNKNPFDLYLIDTSKQIILFPKNNLLKKKFGIYFKQMFFDDKYFCSMKKYFKYYFENIHNMDSPQNININNFLNFPSIIKNFTPVLFYFSGLFLRKNLDFFIDPQFNITHSYFIEQAKKVKTTRIFKKKSYNNDLDLFFKKNCFNLSPYRFYCELITNSNVVFGELLITDSIIFFRSLNRQKFINHLKTDELKASYLLCSNVNDYSDREKKVFMIKSQIHQIFNRRFLYQFQACEFFLKNGKSYFFNLFSSEKQNKFFEVLNLKRSISNNNNNSSSNNLSNHNNNKHNINNNNKLRIIIKLKEEFKKKEFTDLWLNDKISTLSYLLFINKFSSRSYNDTNQYPVIPWMKIKNNKLRNLSYPISAQRDEDKEYLAMKYDLSNPKFQNHHNIHYSNSSFVIYYMFRVDPFTHGQINLQVGKFDSPNRQFNSLNNSIEIFERCRDSRELIPQFYISTEFFYNYNCNFYGFYKYKDDSVIVHNLDEYFQNSPFEYILNNISIINSRDTKIAIHSFIDNIFGVNQIGKKNDYNTFDKYCYQQLVDLKQKINKYQQNKLPFDEIKEKIDRKINKIVSFGQTPLQLFDSKHLVYGGDDKHKKKSTKNLNKNKDIDKNYINISNINNMNNEGIDSLLYEEKGKLITFKNNLMICKISKGNNDQKIIYCCTYNNSFYEFNFFDVNLNKLKEENKITISRKLKFLSKQIIYKNTNITNDANLYSHYYNNSVNNSDKLKYNNNIYAHYFNPKFLYIEYNLAIFIIGRLKENAFMIMTNEISPKTKMFLTESFVTTVCKSSNNTFFTGHYNGKIIEWEILGNSFKDLTKFNEEKITYKRALLAHEKAINGIYINSRYEIVTTCGLDNVIYIRKYYDFEMLSVINIKDQLCYELKISNSFIYVLLFNQIVKKYQIKIFTLNGLCIKEGNFDYINNFELDQNNNLYVGYYKENKISIFDPTFTNIKDEIKLINNEEITNNNLFINFIISNDINSIFCYFSNNVLLKKDLIYINNNKNKNQQTFKIFIEE